MNMKTIDIPEYEIDGLILTLKETGLKGWSKYMDVISLNHVIERGFLPSERKSINRSIKERNRNDLWRDYKPYYTI